MIGDFTEEEEKEILRWADLGPEDKIRAVLKFCGDVPGPNHSATILDGEEIPASVYRYWKVVHIRAARYTWDVKYLLEVIDRLREGR